MIYVGENKATLCKGNFHPAQLYKGEMKIAGYTEAKFEGASGITLENCYNDKIYDAQIRSKNLLDVKKLYGTFANENGGITLHSGQLYNFSISQKSLNGVFKENTQYTFSFKYNITEATTMIMPQFVYTDGTKDYMYIGSGVQSGTGVGEGETSIVSRKGKTVKSFSFTYGSNINTRFECELSNMQIEEGVTATEYEAPLTEATITARGKNILDMAKYTVSQGYYLDSSGNKQNTNTRFIKISPIAVEPSTQYTISIGTHYLYSIWFCKTIYENDGISRVSPQNVKNWTFTTPENCTYIRVSIDGYYTGGIAIPTDLEWAMLEKGTGDGIYEPYIEPQTVMFENGELTTDIPTFKGTTVIEVDAENQATIRGKYKKTEG